MLLFLLLLLQPQRDYPSQLPSYFVSPAELLSAVEYPTDALQFPLTLVSAYYSLTHSKHNESEYMNWIPNFYSYAQQPMFIATSPALFPTLARMRYKHCLNEERLRNITAADANELQRQPDCPPTHWFLKYDTPLQFPWMEQLQEDLQPDLVQHKLDPWREWHHPHLYATWAT